MNNAHARRNILFAAVIALGLMLGAWWWNTYSGTMSRSAVLYEDTGMTADQAGFGQGTGELPSELQSQPALSVSTEPDDLEADLNNTTILDVGVESL